MEISTEGRPSKPTRSSGHGRGFSPVGFLILLCLMVGLLGETMTGLVLGLVVGLIVAGVIARSMVGATARPSRRSESRVESEAPAITPKPTCLCGSSEHTTLDHSSTGPHSKAVEAQFQSQLAVELVAGRIKVGRRGGE